LGWCFEEGNGVDKDEAMAMPMYREAATGECFLRLALMLGRAGRTGESMELLRVAGFTHGDVQACEQLAKEYRKMAESSVDKAEKIRASGSDVSQLDIHNYY
jgi:TPR repeat protein